MKRLPLLADVMRNIWRLMKLGEPRDATFSALLQSQFQSVVRGLDVLRAPYQKQRARDFNNTTDLGRLSWEGVRTEKNQGCVLKLPWKLKPSKKYLSGTIGFQQTFLLEEDREALSAANSIKMCWPSAQIMQKLHINSFWTRQPKRRTHWPIIEHISQRRSQRLVCPKVFKWKLLKDWRILRERLF